MATNEYYSLDEVCEILGMSADEVKSLVADGRLHEVRDGGKVFFRREEADRIAAKEGSSIVDLATSDEIDLGAPEEDETKSFADALSSLADSSSGLGLSGEEAGAVEEPAELDLDAIPEDLPAAPKAPESETPELSSEIDLFPAAGEESGAAAELEAPDLGLSGSSIISLEAPDEGSSVMPAVPTDAGAEKKGISVFDEDELDVQADPLGETQVSAGLEEFDTTGSGSGLLDLTQESDDTSLGAELLDVISPTEGETATEAEVVEAETVEDAEPIAAVVDEEPIFAPAAAPSAPQVRAAAQAAGMVPLNVCAVLGIVGIAVLGLAAAAQIQGVWPEFLDFMASGVVHISVFAGLAVIAAVLGILGIVAGKK